MTLRPSTTLRIALLGAVLVAGVAMLAPHALAQATPAAPVAPAKEAVPQNLWQVISWNIDPVFVIIFLLSIVALTFIIQGFIRTRRSVVMPETTVAQIRDYISNRQYQELIDFTEADPSFVSKAINPALKRAPNYNSMKEALEISVGEQTADSFRKIEILNIIGNMGPLLGLLGTVLGMIEAFTKMASAGSTDPGVLAAGISKALAHTFLGLFLAVPALMAFGILRQMTDKLTTRAAIVSEELLSLMKPSDGKATSTAPAAKPAMK
ncbi:MAG: MotA/TolQ/ExbB proton channel family protein [Tepidisphaeraceae bacterium]